MDEASKIFLPFIFFFIMVIGLITTTAPGTASAPGGIVVTHNGQPLSSLSVSFTISFNQGLGSQSGSKPYFTGGTDSNGRVVSRGSLMNQLERDQNFYSFVYGTINGTATAKSWGFYGPIDSVIAVSV